MPRKSETIRMLEVACREHGWHWARTSAPFDHSDTFERSSESIRVVSGMWINAALNQYFIDHRCAGGRKIWIVQAGRRAQFPSGAFRTRPHVVLKAHHGKPRFTFALWFKNTFLTGHLDPANEQLISDRKIEAGLL